MCELLLTINYNLSLVVFIGYQCIVNYFLGLFVQIKSLHDIFGFALAVEQDFLLVFDDDTEQFSLNLEVIDPYPFVRVIVFNVRLSTSTHPAKLFNEEPYLFDKVHFRGYLPSYIFG